MIITRIKVTPAMAKDWMKQNIARNRKVRIHRVEAYAADMKAQRWVEDSGETIKFDVNDNLVDGQHRLLAIIESGCTITFSIAKGVPTNAVAVFDTGLKRGLADTLSFQGVDVPARVSPILKWVHSYKHGNPMNRTRVPVSSIELAKFYWNDSKRFDLAAEIAKDIYQQKIGTTATAGTAYYLFSEISKQYADNFFEGLVSGANLNGRSPVLVLRNRLLSHKFNRLKQHEILCLYIRGWNHYLEDNPVTALLAIGNDKKPLSNDNFPRILLKG